MEKEFVVTVKESANWEELHNELNRDTTLDDSVDSNIVPDRTVDTVKLRANNKKTELISYARQTLFGSKIRKEKIQIIVKNYLQSTNRY